MTLAHERRRALEALPEAAAAILGYTARALRHPKTEEARVSVVLLRGLNRALRHYPTPFEIDENWSEERRAAE